MYEKRSFRSNVLFMSDESLALWSALINLEGEFLLPVKKLVQCR